MAGLILSHEDTSDPLVPTPGLGLSLGVKG